MPAFLPLALVPQRQPLLHIARNIMPYRADDGSDSPQASRLDARVTDLRGGIDCASVIDGVCPHIEIIGLVVAADDDTITALGAGRGDGRSGIGRSGQIAATLVGGGTHRLAIGILGLTEAVRRISLIFDDCARIRVHGLRFP